MKYIFPLILICILFTNCAAKKEAKTPEHLPLIGRWEISSFNGNDSVETIFNNRRPYINFSDSIQFNGNTGCNSISGDLTLNQNKITFKVLLSTKMFCINIPEDEFIRLLESINTFKIEKENLYLLKDNKLLLAFKYSKKE